MKSVPVLLVASVLALAACSSTAPPGDQASPKASASAAPAARRVRADPAVISAGRQVFMANCAVCHAGANDRAPQLPTLRTLEPQRVAAALSKGGLMELQSRTLTPEQHEQVVAFVTAPEDLGAGGMDMIMTAKEEYRPGFSYPVRSAHDPRDNPSAGYGRSWQSPKLGDGPFLIESWEQPYLKVSVVLRDLEAPRGIAFLPDGSMLIIERAGALRIVRNGELDPKPVAGAPVVAANLGISTGFMDIVLHPDFKTNGLVYFAYSKALDDLGVTAIYRGRWDGKAIVDGKDIFVADDVDTYYTALTFGADGKLYATIGGPSLGTDASLTRAQHLDDYAGKVLRLNDDGTAPSDNPFVGRKDANPEIFTYGHRVNIGITTNPETKDIWVSENGPWAGDELNVLHAGQNYGWPVVSSARFYGGELISEEPYKKGFAGPLMVYSPSIAPSGMTFYTGDKFPAWKNNLFIGAMQVGEGGRTGHIQRLVFSDKWQPLRSEMLLFELHQRIRSVVQGPDGYLYVFTDEGANSVLMKIEPGAKP